MYARQAQRAGEDFLISTIRVRHYRERDSSVHADQHEDSGSHCDSLLRPVPAWIFAVGHQLSCGAPQPPQGRSE